MRFKEFCRQWQSRLLAMTHDLCMIPVAWLAAFWIKDNLAIMPEDSLAQALQSLPIVIGLQAMAFFSFGLYRGLWRYSSMLDVMRIIKSVAVGTVAITLVLFFVTRADGLPRSLFLLYGLVLGVMLSGTRVLVRWFQDNPLTWHPDSTRVLVVGAGQAAESLIRDLRRPQQQGAFETVGVVADKPDNIGRDIHGVPVVGTFERIVSFVHEHDIDRIMIALPNASAQKMRALLTLCEQTNCLVSILPSMSDLVDGRVTVEHLRMVSIEDLLGRDPVELAWTKIKEHLSHQTVFVSGGGGSIGSELCRQIMRLNPKSLVVVDNSEYYLFQLQQELSKSFPKAQISYHLAAVTDSTTMHNLMARYQPACVYHAAAYKHVPLLEAQPREAVYNNVLGTESVARAAVANKVKHFVFVSTDKAVNPTNVMGTTKRVSEMVCQYYQQRAPETNFTMVRFGNVLGSRGSVVETFSEQIAQGGPVTVTHPDVTRYFMTIPEACQLILQATVTGRGGEIFILDMGEPIKICKLAEQMIRLSGKQVGVDIEISYTGLRPGEKLFEELFHAGEPLGKTEHPKLLTAQSRSVDWQQFEQQLTTLKSACSDYDTDIILRILKTLVPECQSEIVSNTPLNDKMDLGAA